MPFVRPAKVTLTLDKVAKFHIDSTVSYTHLDVYKRQHEGDIVSVDVGACYNGFHGDSAFTFACGRISPEAQRLLDVTQQSLYKGIEQAVPGNRLGDISWAVQQWAENAGFAVVTKYVGHGVGSGLHESPDVPNYGKAGRGVRLLPGMTIAIEPMICLLYTSRSMVSATVLLSRARTW